MNNFLILFYAWMIMVCLLLAQYYHHLQYWLFPTKEKHQPVKVRLLVGSGGDVSQVLQTTSQFELSEDKQYFEATFPDLARALSMVQSLKYYNTPDAIKRSVVSFAMVELGGNSLRFLTTHKLDQITSKNDRQKLIKIQNMFERSQPAYDNEAYTHILAYMKGK